MLVEKNKVISFEYHLTSDDGDVIDSNMDARPLEYLHGYGNIISGLEEALEGKQSGDEFSLTVEAEKAYGPRRDELIETVPRDEFEDPDQLEVGMQFELPIPEENSFVLVSVAEISGDEITIDANHELAGMNLHFDIKVGDIRDATAEEIEEKRAFVDDEDA